MSTGEEVTLRQYIERLIDERHKLYESKFEAHKVALDLAKCEIDRRLEQMNKFREENIQDKLKSVSRQEWQTGHQSLIAQFDEKMVSIDRRFATVERMIWVGTGIVLSVSAMIAVLVKLLKI
jgi:polynucleotide 5'-kinase involved in rRNA processing